MKENKELAKFWKELAAKANELRTLMDSGATNFTLKRDEMAKGFLQHMQQNYRGLGDLDTVRQNLTAGQGFLMKVWCDDLTSEKRKEFSSDIQKENVNYFLDQLINRNTEHQIFKPDPEKTQKSRPVTAEVVYALMKTAEWENNKGMVKEMFDLMTSNKLRNEVGMKLIALIDARHDKNEAIASRAQEVVKIIIEVNSKPQQGLQNEVDIENAAQRARTREPDAPKSKKEKGMIGKIKEKIGEKKQEREFNRKPWLRG